MNLLTFLNKSQANKTSNNLLTMIFFELIFPNFGVEILFHFSSQIKRFTQRYR